MDERVLNSMFDSAQQRHASGEKMKFTEEESNRFKKAFADPEFRKMFAQYMDELQDPAHREETEAYISQLESEQKVPEGKELIRPRAGFVAKTYKTMDGAAGPEKVFLNIVQSEKVTPPSRTRSAKGDNWSVPYTVGPPHMEKDKKGENSTCFDCCFHPEALELASSNRDFKDLLVNTAMDGVEEMFTRQGFKATLDRKFHLVKGMSYKEGQVLTMMIASTSKSTWSKPSSSAPAAPSATSPSSPLPPPPPSPASTAAEAAPNVASSSGKKGRQADPPASAADEEVNTPATLPAAQPANPKKAPAAAPAIKRGFLNSPKKAIYADKVPTIRPSGGDKGLLQEVQGLRADGGHTTAKEATTVDAPAGLTAVSTKKVSRPATSAPPAEPAPATGPVKPVVVVKHSAALSLGDFDAMQRQQVASARPSELVYEIQLPLLESAAGMALDLSEQKLLLSCRDIYHLDLDLPYRVYDQRAKASFDKHKRVLTVRLPVVQATTPIVIEEAVEAVGDVGKQEDPPRHGEPASAPHPAKAATGKEHSRWISSPPPSSSSTSAGGQASSDSAEGSRSLQEEILAQAALAKQRAAEMVGKAPSKPAATNPPPPSPSPASVAAAVEASASTEPFVPSRGFAGRRTGYVFRNGDLGVGYYRDGTSPAPPSSSAGAKECVEQQAVTAASPSASCAVPYEVQETPKAVALLLQVPRVVATSVQLNVTRFGLDVSFDAISDAAASPPLLQRYAQGFSLDESRCPGGLDAKSAKFDAAGKNAVIVVCKEKSDSVWETDDEEFGQPWIQSRDYAGATVEGKNQGLSAVATGVENLALAASSPSASATAAATGQRGEAKPAPSVAATQATQSMAAATVSAMQFNADILSELD